MTAGKGVQHCEMFPLVNQDKPNPLELFQIWLNLPRSAKMAEPHFAMLWSDTIPTYTHLDSEKRSTSVYVVSGRIEKTLAPDPAPDSWAADRAHDVAIWLITMEAGARWNLPAASPGTNRSLYFYEGSSIGIDGSEITQHQALELVADAEVPLVNGKNAARLLLLQGKPIGEQVVQYGPFVGNSQADIQQAYQDFQKTQFGGWPWPSYENVHPREQGRFAKYPDGRVESR